MKEEQFLSKEEFAKLIDGNQYRNEHTREQAKLAKDNGLVIVYGASDDLVEFEGVICDEIGSYEKGITLKITKKLNIKETKKDHKNNIHAFWCPKNDEGEIIASWVISSNIPHATFKVMEDDELYCIGIVFSIFDLDRD
jgi:hypothetical protein